MGAFDAMFTHCAHLMHRTMRNHYFFFASVPRFQFSDSKCWICEWKDMWKQGTTQIWMPSPPWTTDVCPICRVMHNVRSNISRCVAKRLVSDDTVRRCQPHDAGLHIWDRSVAHVQRPYRNLETQTDIICLTVALSLSPIADEVSHHIRHTHTPIFKL